MNTQLYAREHDALTAAAWCARANGAPVAVVYDRLTHWYRVVDDAEEYDELVTVDGFDAVAVVVEMA